MNIYQDLIYSKKCSFTFLSNLLSSTQSPILLYSGEILTQMLKF